MTHNYLARVLAKHGRLDQAAAAYREDLQLRPNCAMSHEELGCVLKSQGKLAEAEKEFQEVIRLDEHFFDNGLANSHEMITRGRFFEAAHLWAMAAPKYPEPDPVLLRATALQLFVGDRSAYESLCLVMILRFSKTTDAELAEQTAKVCVLSQEPVGALSDAARLADLAIEDSEHQYFPFFCFTRALVAYRAGDLDGCLKWCEETHPEDPGESLKAQALIVEAMALHRQGKEATARKRCDEAAMIIRARFPFAPDSFTNDWEGWIIYEILRREAARLLTTSAEELK
jgi:tetratricopeptide (TPR) repeat protein